MPKCASINRMILKMPRVLKMPKFWIWQNSEYDGFQNASVRQSTEYPRICLDKILNIPWVLNMPGFWTWQGSEYARITQGSKYATIWLNMSEQDVNIAGYYVSYNKYCKIFLKVHEYLLRDCVFRTRSKI